MTELVLLQDVVASYGSLWVRIANTQGHDQIKMHDRFREQGFGEGAEELEIEGVDFSPVSGASRVFVRRAANNTRAEVHRMGAVMQRVATERVNISAVVAEVLYPTANGSASADAQVAPAITTTSVEGIMDEPLVTLPKRGRGRPKGARNKPKPQLQSRPEVPAWPGM